MRSIGRFLQDPTGAGRVGAILDQLARFDKIRHDSAPYGGIGPIWIDLALFGLVCRDFKVSQHGQDWREMGKRTGFRMAWHDLAIFGEVRRDLPRFGDSRPHLTGRGAIWQELATFGKIWHIWGILGKI